MGEKEILLNDVSVVIVSGVGAYKLILYLLYTAVFFSEMQKKKGKIVLLIVNDKEGQL